MTPFDNLPGRRVVVVSSRQGLLDVDDLELTRSSEQTRERAAVQRDRAILRDGWKGNDSVVVSQHRTRGTSGSSISSGSTRRDRTPPSCSSFMQTLATDRGYHDWLVRHYTMWKRVVDDEAHPAHTKLRGTTHDDPKHAAAFPRQELS